MTLFIALMNGFFALVGATVSSNGSFALESSEVSTVTTTMTNAGTSILSMFMQFWQPIVILAVIIGVISFILNKIGHKG